jgi:hypothetical protein
MAQFDIMPFDMGAAMSAVRYAALNASETFKIGDVVNLNDDGELEMVSLTNDELELGDLDGGRLCGVAAMSGDTGATAGVYAGNTYPNAAPFGGATTGDRISYWPADQGILFITSQVFASGGAAAGIPPGTIVGEALFFTYSSTLGHWGIELADAAYGTEVVAIIHQVLDAQKNPIAPANTTDGVYVVFEIKTNA